MVMDAGPTGQPQGLPRLSREHASGLLWYDTQEMATSMRNEVVAAALEVCPAKSRDILQDAMGGAELTFEQGLQLATAEGAALEALLAVADQLRRETVGDAITYVVNRNINFTNVCFVGCSFCGFGRGPGAADAYSLSFEEVVRRAREAWSRGATEVCIQGGLPRDLDGFFYRDLLRAVKRAIPEMHVHAFSPMEIDYGVLKTGIPLRDYLQMMKDEGLGSIPGTAAEILDDRVRQELSPNKLPAGRWVEIIAAAHELGIPTTSTMMYGHVEEPADWVRHILLLRAIQKRTGGFTEFVPLGFIHENTRLYRHGGARPGAKREEHLRVHALSRVLLRGAINNLQVSWVKLGFEMSLACLQAGANDFSGTLMEESISRDRSAACLRNAQRRTRFGGLSKARQTRRTSPRGCPRWARNITLPTPKALTERFPCAHSCSPSKI